MNTKLKTILPALVFWPSIVVLISMLAIRQFHPAAFSDASLIFISSLLCLSGILCLYQNRL